MLFIISLPDYWGFRAATPFSQSIYFKFLMRDDPSAAGVGADVQASGQDGDCHDGASLGYCGGEYRRARTWACGKDIVTKHADKRPSDTEVAGGVDDAISNYRCCCQELRTIPR